MAKLFDLPRWIAVEGPIRAGKSSLANILAERMGARRISEPENNPFLDRFYQGEHDAAFPAQMWFLHERHQQMLGEKERDRELPLVSDYIFEKDKLFAYINLSDAELDLYNHYYNRFREDVPAPDLVIYLQATPEVLKQRLRRKDIPNERAISESYLEQIVRAYEHFFFHYTASDLLVVNTSDIDFVNSNGDLQLLLGRLAEPVKGTQYFLPLGAEAREA
jgi:deoxyadenosine/deoxycytidine kinase